MNALAMPDACQTETVLTLPLGLLGFERVKRYVLVGRPEEAPFLWLRREDEPNLAFLVLAPAEVDPSYRPELGADDASFLGVGSPEDVTMLSIVTLHQDGRATINLKGPIVINRRTGVAKQVIPANAAQYNVHHPLPTAA